MPLGYFIGVLSRDTTIMRCQSTASSDKARKPLWSRSETFFAALTSMATLPSKLFRALIDMGDVVEGVGHSAVERKCEVLQ